MEIVIVEHPRGIYYAIVKVYKNGRVIAYVHRLNKSRNQPHRLVPG